MYTINDIDTNNVEKHNQKVQEEIEGDKQCMTKSESIRLWGSVLSGLSGENSVFHNMLKEVNQVEYIDGFFNLYCDVIPYAFLSKSEYKARVIELVNKHKKVAVKIVLMPVKANIDDSIKKLNELTEGKLEIK